MLQALSTEPIMTRSVYELLWGYDDATLFNISQFKPDMIPSIVVSIFNASVILFTVNTGSKLTVPKTNSLETNSCYIDTNR